jgi:hypothetical protein
MTVGAAVATLHGLAHAATGLSACLRIESRLASGALTPVTVADLPVPAAASLVRTRLTRASAEVRWAAGHLDDAHRAARAIARHGGASEGEGRAPRLARSCSRLVDELEDALADTEHHPGSAGTVLLIVGHRQVTEALVQVVNWLHSGCNQVRRPAGEACAAVPRHGQRAGEVTGALFHAAIGLQHTRSRVADATDALVAHRTAAAGTVA